MIKNFNQTAKFLGVAQNTLRKILKEDPTFPRPIQLSTRRIGFRLEEVNDWIESKRLISHDEAA